MCCKNDDGIRCGKLSEANLAIHTARFEKLEVDGAMCLPSYNLTTRQWKVCLILHLASYTNIY